MNLAFLLPAALGRAGGAAAAAADPPGAPQRAAPDRVRRAALAAAKPKPRHRLRFDEWPLLLLRLLLLVALALLLARPVLFGSASHAPWVAVVPGVDLQAVARAATRQPDARRHWLAPGFPPLGQAPRRPAPLPLIAACCANWMRRCRPTWR